MAILTIDEVKNIVEDFISENQSKLECKKYGFEEILRREGDQDQIIYIVKEGVFRIGKLDTWEPDITVAFCFKSDIFISLSAVAPCFPSLFHIKSIKNNLCNYNEIYEISIEQWNYLVEKNDKFKNILTSISHYNLTMVLNVFSIFRKNKKTKEFLNAMYDMKHPILNSGISNKYLADFFGTTPNTLLQILAEKQLEEAKKK